MSSSTRRGEAATLSRWDRLDSPLAPISASQRDVLSEISALFTSDSGKAEESLRGSDKNRESEARDDATVSEDGTAASSSELSVFPAVKELMEGRKVETGHQFLEWVHDVEKSLQHQEDTSYRRYIRRLDSHISDAQNLLTHVNDSLNILKCLENQYEYVKSNSNSLHEACQHLITKQDKLSILSENVSQVLVYYTEADKISLKLTSPTLSVNSDQFLGILSKIDNCLLFINEHNGFRQNETYKVKYQACLARALSLIKSHVHNNLEKTTSAIQTSSIEDTSSSVDANNEKSFTLFYGKFRTLAPRISHLMRQVESRTSKGFESSNKYTTDMGYQGPSPLWQEYETLLSDCQSIYFQCRNRLLLSSIHSTIVELTNKHVKDHCGLMRAGYSFMLHICDDEHQLYHHFFESSTPLLTEYLENLSQVLYDTLRPLIIHLHHLETLSELTGILRSELSNGPKSHPHLESSFHKVMSQLLQDVQERLVYRAYVYIKTDISGYVPAKGDLAYPEKLEMMRSIADSISQGEEKENRQRKHSTASAVSTASMEVANINFKNSPADLHGMWYPPLRRTLLCLSKLYRCLERGIFQGLSQDALNACVDSISNAASLISQAPKKSPIDGQLFEIKHLLILREQIAPFQVDFAVKELSLDFSKLKSKAFSILSNKRNLLEFSSSNALLELMIEGATPDVKETYVDSRKEVDKRLKAACQALIFHVTVLVVGPIKSFISQCEDFKKNSGSVKNAKLNSQPWARAEDLQNKVSVCLRQLKKYFPEVQKSMQLYLSNPETEFILFRPIRNDTISTFIGFYQLTKSDFSPDERVIIGCPTQEQISVLISSLQLRPTSSNGNQQSPKSELPGK